MIDFIHGLRDAVLITGIREADFWQMTIGEAARACNAYEEQRKDRAYFAFTNALAVGLFVSSMFSKSQSAPSIDTIYPELFPKDEEAEEKVKEERSIANFMKMANAINERFRNGNRESESKNNG